MEATIILKVKSTTSNPRATPHRMGEALVYKIEQIQTDAENKVLDWKLESYDPMKIIPEAEEGSDLGNDFTSILKKYPEELVLEVVEQINDRLKKIVNEKWNETNKHCVYNCHDCKLTLDECIKSGGIR